MSLTSDSGGSFLSRPLPRFSRFRSKPQRSEGRRGRRLTSCILPENIYRVRERHGRRTKGSETAFLQIPRPSPFRSVTARGYFYKCRYRFYRARRRLADIADSRYSCARREFLQFPLSSRRSLLGGFFHENIYATNVDSSFTSYKTPSCSRFRPGGDPKREGGEWLIQLNPRLDMGKHIF